MTLLTRESQWRWDMNNVASDGLQRANLLGCVSRTLRSAYQDTIEAPLPGHLAALVAQLDADEQTGSHASDGQP